jgi:hypothetical protein
MIRGEQNEVEKETWDEETGEESTPMRRLLLAGLMAALVSPAYAATDLMAALMETDNGKQELHTIPTSACMETLALVKKQHAMGQKFKLMLHDPDFTGYVLEVSCIKPDGSVISENPKLNKKAKK